MSVISRAADRYARWRKPDILIVLGAWLALATVALLVAVVLSGL